MAGRRLIYLAVLMLCGIFYIAYGQWLSFLILVTVLLLPWFSLLISLPALFQCRIAPSGPSRLEMGECGELWLMGSAPCPMPPFRGKLKLKRAVTGESWYYQEPEDLDTRHCGSITITAEVLRVSDYLGLFSFPIHCREVLTVLIPPQPVKMELQQELQQYIAHSWKPKFGGGYAENHELRLYRPGDSLNQVHWKLSAKTNSLIIREPMEPQSGLILLTMNLRGRPDVLDRKLGRLLWLGNYLLEQALRFEVHAMTGDGLLTFSISTGAELDKCMDTLLCSRAAEKGDLKERDIAASWHCHIGGAMDEA